MKHKQIAKKLIYLPARYLLTLTAVTALFFCTEVSANASAENVHEMAAICIRAKAEVTFAHVDRFIKGKMHMKRRVVERGIPV